MILIYPTSETDLQTNEGISDERERGKSLGNIFLVVGSHKKYSYTNIWNSRYKPYRCCIVTDTCVKGVDIRNVCALFKL